MNSDLKEIKKETCSVCGKAIVEEKDAGGVSGFFNRGKNCRCSPDRFFADGAMSKRFWKLKQTRGGSVFMSNTQGQDVVPGSNIDLIPGAIIGGTYEIVELIGRGGMGEVYLANHLTLAKKCALKVMPPDQVNQLGWRRFQLEARAVARLEHVNLVRVTDLGIHEGCLPFYAMDYVDGKNLSDLIAESGPMPLNTVLEIFMQVCDAVECAHRSGILHRDLKPANIMLSTNNSGKKEAKVLDFGLAKLTGQDRDQQSLTAVGDVFGSPFYMSPEQCGGEKLDHRSDIYSIGCTMFECLTGRPPFNSHLPSTVMFNHLEADPPTLESVVGAGKFPPPLEIVIAKLLRKNPGERYQSMMQLKSDLERVAAGQDVLPIYVSRVNKSLEEKFSNSPYKFHDSQSPSFASPRAVLTLALVSVSLVSILGAFFIFQPKLQTVSVETKPIAVDGINLPDKPLIQPVVSEQENYTGKPFYQGLKKIDGKNVSEWRMPEVLRGSLAIDGSSQGSTVTISLPETNETVIRVSEKDNVRLHILPGFLYRRGYVQGIGKEGYEEVDLRNINEEGFEYFTHKLASAKCIRAIRVGNESWSYADTKASIPFINKFEWLERLLLGSRITAEDLGHIKRLDKMEILSLQGQQPQLEACLKPIGKLKLLKSLSILDGRELGSSLADLSGCTALKTMVIGAFKGTHSQLKDLAKLKHLEKLSLTGVPYRADLASDFHDLKSLKVLELGRINSWGEERDQRLESLKRTLSGVKVSKIASSVIESDDSF